jgi:hypothetical protein
MNQEESGNSSPVLQVIVFVVVLGSVKFELSVKNL